jgi:hypothetical protein
VSIYLENVLYETPLSGNFFVHVEVVSGVEVPLGVDLGSYWDMVGPVQFTDSKEPSLTVVDICTRIPPEMTDSLVSQVVKAMYDGRTTALAPFGSTDYYIDFNAAGRASIDSLSRPWLMLAMGGWLLVTDGAEVEAVGPEEGFAFIPIRQPVEWAEIPAGSIVAFDGPMGPMIRSAPVSIGAVPGE